MVSFFLSACSPTEESAAQRAIEEARAAVGEAEFVEITKPDEPAVAGDSIVFYNVGDLGDAKMLATELGGEPDVKDATIKTKNGVLIVTASAQAHRAINAWLDTRRQAVPR